MPLLSIRAGRLIGCGGACPGRMHSCQPWFQHAGLVACHGLALAVVTPGLWRTAKCVLFGRARVLRNAITFRIGY